MDARTKNPIPYVNIGIAGKNIGTVSDEQGNFVLEIKSKAEEEAVTISAIGYETVIVSTDELSRDGTLALKPISYSMDEVEIKATKFDGPEQIFGVKNKARGLSISFESTLLGTEIGTPIPIDQPTYIKSANFVLNHAKGDSILFRINIYAFEDGNIGENLLKENIYIREKQRKGVISIDLTPYSLVLDQDVLLSLEWLRNFDELGNKGITFDTKKGKKLKGIYTKWTSQSDFRIISYNTRKNLCFYFTGKQEQ